MKLNQLSGDIAYKSGVSRLVQLLLAVSILSNLLLAVALAMADRTHRETMVPPTIHKTFWVEDSKVSPEYLEEMGFFLLQLSLNNSPVSAENNAKMLLKYVAPQSYGDMERTLLSNAKRLRENNASTMFSARSVTPNPNDNSIVFSGVMTTFIADKRVAEVSQTYIVRLAYSGGRVFVVEMRETDPKEPFKEQPHDPAAVPADTN